MYRCELCCFYFFIRWDTYIDVTMCAGVLIDTALLIHMLLGQNTSCWAWNPHLFLYPGRPYKN